MLPLVHLVLGAAAASAPTERRAWAALLTGNVRARPAKRTHARTLDSHTTSNKKYNCHTLSHALAARARVAAAIACRSRT